MPYTCSKDPSHQSDDSDYCSICGAKIAGASSILGTPPANLTYAAQGGGAQAGSADVCPDCGTPRHPGAKFCEICRYNFDAHTSGGGAASMVDAAPAMPPPTVDAAPVAAPAAVVVPPVLPPDNAPAVTAFPSPLAAPWPPLNAASPNAAPTAPGNVVGAQPGLLKWDAVVSVDPSLYTDPDPDLVLPTDEPERTFPLDFAENLLGRRSDRKDIHPEIPVGDPGVSHRHAKLLRQPDGSFQLLDVGSTNGTRLNGVDIKPGVRTPLQDGDQITVGCWTRITICVHL